MYQAGHVELRSSGLLQAHTADRPSFETVIRRGMFGPKCFQVFALPKGLLFLELRHTAVARSAAVSKAAVTGAILGGAIGAVVGQMIANQAVDISAQEPSFDRLDDDDLLELAGRRKHSFVAKNDEIQSLSIDVPRGVGKLFVSSNLAGWITLRDSCLGKVKMEVRDQSALSVAVDSLPRRFGERVSVNVELDINACRFITKR